MTWWQLLIVLVVANLATESVSGVLANLVGRKLKVSAIDMMNQEYISLWFGMILGGIAHGYVWYIWWGSGIMGAIVGVVAFVLVFLFTDVRRYNSLCTLMEIYEIDTNEKLEQFLKEQKET